jgi:hypothetical protein
MPLRFTDHYAMSIIQPQLLPQEHVLYKSRGVERPWWTRLFFRMGAFAWRHYLVVATNQRLLLIEHGTVLGGYRPKGTDAMPWSEIDFARLGWGIFEKKLNVRASARRWGHKIALGRFWMKNNFASGQSIVDTWSQARQLGGSQRAVAALGA